MDPSRVLDIGRRRSSMRLPILLLSAVFALAMTDAGVAQATLPNDDVNIANNPGTSRDAPRSCGGPGLRLPQQTGGCVRSKQAGK
jgi:hypothetical protein